MTRTEAFRKLLDDKDNGLDSKTRKMWKFRFKSAGLSDRLITAELVNYGYKETTPGDWSSF